MAITFSRSALMLVLAHAAVCSAFQPAAPNRLAASRVASSRARMDLSQAGAGDASERIGAMVKENKIMVFMKGSKLMPQCGFSNAVVQVFNSIKVPYTTFDVLSDPEIRQGIKEYSSWPTIPQARAGASRARQALPPRPPARCSPVGRHPLARLPRRSTSTASSSAGATLWSRCTKRASWPRWLRVSRPSSRSRPRERSPSRGSAGSS